MVRRGLWSGLLALVLVISAFAGSGVLQPRTAEASQFGSVNIYFGETGHHLGGDFLNAWQTNGGLMTFGYPISEPFQQDGRLVQYFERARFERHEEHAGTRYVVQATLLGNWLAESLRDEPAFRPLPPDTGTGGDAHRLFFPETGHSLAYGFKNYWEQNGGLYVFGYPISEEFSEKNYDTGEIYTVQYFERARFEWHPENRGTQYEVLLGRLGAQYGEERGIDPSPVGQMSGSLKAFSGLLDPKWSKAIRTADGGTMGVIKGSVLNIRTEPRLDAPVAGTTFERHPVTVYETVPGDAVEGVPVWYRIGDGRYVAAVWVDPFVAPAAPVIHSGRWVDVNLSNFYAVAYEGGQPVYAAIITAGRDGKTPIGTFQIFSRVRSETMDSSTVGIQKGQPGYYYLDNVEFTQYFRSGGYAIHGNYWTAPSSFGSFSSNGCVGMMNHDAGWFWNFLGVGSTVAIHY